MKQLLALTLCASILLPSVSLAGEPLKGRLNLSGTETLAAIAEVTRSASQNSTPSPDDKLLGMHWAVTQLLFAAGIGAAIGTFAVRGHKDADGNPLPITAGDRSRGALLGAAVGAGFWGLFLVACSKGCN